MTDQDFARWAGITLGDARGRACATRPGSRRASSTASSTGSHAERADARAAPRRPAARTYLLAGFDEYLLGYKDRDAMLDPAHAGKVVPGANGVFRPMVVIGGQIVGTWTRSVRARSSHDRARIRSRPAAGSSRPLLQAEAERYRGFLGLPAAADPSCRRSPEASCARRRPVHARPARARPAGARRRAGAARARRAAVRVRPRRCSRASVRPTAWPSCSTRWATWMPRCAQRGGALVVREGEVVDETMRVAGEARAQMRSS